VIRPEVKYGEGSRIDFLLQAPGRPDCYVEVKNVTAAVEGGMGYFPDAVTTRGAKHLREMARWWPPATGRCWCSACSGATWMRVRPADHIDPAYGRAFDEALRRRRRGDRPGRRGVARAALARRTRKISTPRSTPAPGFMLYAIKIG
jgi:DNA-binding sugar fermentation-stimulating protein